MPANEPATDASMRAMRLDIEPGLLAFDFSGLSLTLSLSDQPGKRMGIGGDRMSRRPLTAEQSYILPPSANGVCEFCQNHQAVVVEFAQPVLSEVGLLPGREFAPTFDLDDPLLRQLALASADMTFDTPALYRESLSRALAAHVVQIVAPAALELSETIIDDRRLNRAREFIKSSLQENLSLQDMAAAATMSPYHFSRVFKKATGHSPLQYVILERMQRAELLLRTTKESIASIAGQVGYCDSVRFARHFKRHTSLSPSEFRVTRAG